MTITAVRGTQDLLPGRSGLWQEVEHKCRRLAAHCGFQEIRTPMFEKADLFVRGLGVMAGLVERDLWTFHDKHGQKLALRADLTACVVRAYCEHGLGSSMPTRLYYLAPVFLLGKESGDGSRQAHQFGAEVLGCESPALDAELMAMACELATSLGLPEVTLELNTLGCERCRPAYHDCLRDFYGGHQAELCGTCKRKYKTHPLWTLSCPETACVALAQVSPTIYGLLCQDCKSHFHMVKHLVRELGLPVQLNPRVVKDVEYYNRTTFQVLSRTQVVANGGRYDGLVEQLGGSDTAGIGFAFHLEPVIDILADQLEELPDELEVLLIPEGEEATKVLMPVLHRLRQAGVRAELAYTSQHPPSRFIGRLIEANALRGHAQIEDCDHGDVEKVSPDRIAPRLLARLGVDEGSTAESRGARRKLTRSRKDQRGRNGSAQDHPSGSEARDFEDEAGGRRRRRRRRRRGEGEGEGDDSVESGAVGRRDEPPARPERERGRVGRSLRGRSEREAPRGDREAGRDRGEREAPRGEREATRSRGERETGRDRGEREATRSRGERETGRDRGDRETGRERGDREPTRERGERDSGRDRGGERDDREAGRDRDDREATRERGEREPGRDRGEREAARERGDRERGGRERGPRESGRERASERAPREEDTGKAFIPALILGAGARPAAAAPAPLKKAETATAIEPPAPAKVANWSILPKAKKAVVSEEWTPEGRAGDEGREKASEPVKEPRRRGVKRSAEPPVAEPAPESSEEKAPAKRPRARARRSEEN